MYPENLERTDKITHILEADVSSGDFVISDKYKCRAIMSDTGGEVKVDMFDLMTGTTSTHVLSLPGQMWMQYGNITKVYRYLTGTTATSSQYYNASNTLVNGIKLGK